MSNVRILLYHRVEDLDDDYNLLAVTPDNFKKHMEYLKNNYQFISLDTPLNEWPSYGNSIILTFDDGYYDFYKYALPVLKQLNIPATLFVTTANINTNEELWTDELCRCIFSPKIYHESFRLRNSLFSGVWSVDSVQNKARLYQVLHGLFKLSSYRERAYYLEQLRVWAGLTPNGRQNRRCLNKKEIKEISESGIVIGAHTISHPSLRWQKPYEVDEEICGSKETLEGIIGKKIDLFSYPFGTITDYSKDTIECVRNAGFSKAVVGWPGIIDDKPDAYQLPRFAIRNYCLEDYVDYIENNVFGLKTDNKNKLEPADPSIIQYTGYIYDDNELLASDSKIIIWGIGETGVKLWDYCCALGIKDRIVCFADNDPNKVGTYVNDCPVWELRKIRELKLTNKCYLVSGWYAPMIIEQLLNEKESNIRWEYL